MKKFLFISIAAMVCLGIVLTVGLIAATKGPQQPDVPKFERPSFEFTAPEEDIIYEIAKPGTYYLVAATNQNYYWQRHDLEYSLENNYPYLELFENGEFVFWYRGNHMGTWSEHAGVITVTPQDVFTTEYEFNPEHPEEWKAEHNLTSASEFECHYNTSEETITMKYGIDSMTFKRFDSVQDVIEWLHQYIPEEGGKQIPDFYDQYNNATA